MAWTHFPSTVFASSPGTIVGGACYVGLLAAVSVTDVRARRISNRLVVLIGVLGLSFSVLTQSSGTGTARALLAFALGFALWLPFWTFGMLGAGDVKLFAAASCWLAPSQVLNAALLSAIVGGLLSLVALVLAHGFGRAAFRVAEVMHDPRVLGAPLAVPAGRRTLPYGLALALGLSVVGWSDRLAQWWSHLS